jgi:hypothetical protein
MAGEEAVNAGFKSDVCEKYSMPENGVLYL